jgi:hypothetical protein
MCIIALFVSLSLCVFVFIFFGARGHVYHYLDATAFGSKKINTKAQRHKKNEFSFVGRNVIKNYIKFFNITILVYN